jgi:hypothetical protein
MGAYDDDTILEPESRLIEFICEDEQGNKITCKGRIDAPLGMSHDTVVQGRPNSQLPYRYQIWRERARLNPCCWWQTGDSDETDSKKLKLNRVAPNDPDIFSFRPVTVPSGTFKVKVKNETLGVTQEIDDPDTNVVGGWEHEVTPSFALEPVKLSKVLLSGATSVPTRCSLSKATLWNQGDDGTPPCNGAKTQCPYYTGPTFDYINDNQLATGQPIIGQMVQEVRTYMKDWDSFTEAQKEWENTFVIPYIWAGDKDFPHALSQNVEFDASVSGQIMSLVKIFWDPLTKEASLSKVPSEPVSTVQGSTSNLTPPDFPTLVPNLGEAIDPYLKITYPPSKYSSSSSKGPKQPFIYKSFYNVKQKTYLSGISLSNTTVYAINKTIVTGFVDIFNSNTKDKDITIAVEDLLKKQYGYNSTKGFAYTITGEDRFWDLRSGLDLVQGLNNIIILTQSNGVWGKLQLNINYNFYHIDIFQNGFEADLTAPQTSTLITSLSNLQTANELTFSMIPLVGDKMTISNMYHVYTLDRSFSRLVSGDDFGEPKDQRFWGVFQTKSVLTGSAESGNVVWSKFDNCNRYLLEIKNGAPAIPPAGLKYGWSIKDIFFNVSQGQNIEMEIDSTENSIVRSEKGELIAHNFIIIKPKNDINFKTPKAQSKITLNYYEFSAKSNIEKDDLTEILEIHGNEILDDSYLIKGYGAEAQLGLSTESELQPAAHVYSVDEDQIIFTEYAKYDLSYTVEVSIPGFNNGKPVGRKWFVGVAEKNTSWLRDVEVRYAWSADYDQRPFEPFYYKGGPAELPAAPAEYYTKGLTTYYPMCGDHEINPVGFGSLWFPYDACEQPRVVINDQAIQVDYLIPGVSSIDEKYRGPDFKAPLVLKFNALGFFNPCVWEYSLGTRYHSQAFFIGYSRLRGPISPTFDPVLYGRYIAEDWTFPQMGNRGRDAARVFRTMHFREYLFITPAGPRVGLGWLPVSPHESSASLFEDRPRTIFENQVQNKELAKNFIIDETSITDQKYLMSLSIANESELTSSDYFQESVVLKRAKWEQIYNVNIIRSADGKGTRFPTKGFYHNFKNPSVVWAFKETSPEPARKAINDNEIDNLLITDRITGVTIEKPKSYDTDTGIVLDKFERPVYLGLEENNYKVTINDIKYNEATGQIQEYAKIYINKDLPVYFDRENGNILNVPNDNTRSTETQPYALTNISGLTFPLQYYFEPTSLETNALIPSTADDIEDYTVSGNLFAEEVISYYYIDSIDSQGPVDREQEAFSNVGFIRSLKVSNIVPTMLPKVKKCFNPKDFLLNLNPTINFNKYYGSLDSTVNQYSNVDLKTSQENVFHCKDDARGAIFGKWLSEASLPSPVGHSAYRNNVIITIKFKQPIELFRFKFAYKIEVGTGLNTKIKTDPSIQVTFTDTDSSQHILFSKPEINLGVGKSAKSYFKDVDINVSQYEGLFINKIEINVGKRDAVTDLSLTKFLLNYLTIRTVEESIVSLEPKYIPTTGYSNGDENNNMYLPSQSEKYLTGIISVPDLSDTLEYSGLCEFWQTGLASLDETVEIASRGKISRNWAGPFKSFDVNRTYLAKDEPGTPDVLFVGTLEEMENKQKDIFKEMLQSIENLSNFLQLDLQYFINPYDLNILINKLKLNIPEYKSSFKVKTSEGANSIGEVSTGTKTDQWQFEGYEACPPKKLVPRICVWNGPGTLYGYTGDRKIIVYVGQEAPEICNSNGNLGTIGLLTILQSPPANNIAGSSVVSALTTGESEMNKLSELQFENAQALSTEMKIENYKKELEEKYKQEYNP